MTHSKLEMVHDAASTYPQWPPVLVNTGLSGSIAAVAPDCVPLHPASINDSRLRRRVGGVDCVGILRACHRNLPAYSYLRPLKRTQFKGRKRTGVFATKEETYFRRRYLDFVPREMSVELLQQSILNERDQSDIPKWQGNALAGVPLPSSDDHVVFFPTGQILQQACMYRGSYDQKNHVMSNTVETGAVIRQFEVMGSAETREMYGETSMRVAVRGAANCSVLNASFEYESGPRLEFAHKVSFDEMLYHVTSSPHTDNELAFVTGDGQVQTWNPKSNLVHVRTKNVSVDERLLRCEYSSNPCVLWASNRVRVQSLDVRDPQRSPVELFDLVKMNAPHSQIYSIKRRSSSPFHVIVGSSVSIELLDSRMPGKALLSWMQSQQLNEKMPYYGMVEELQWRGDTHGDNGLILSSTQGHKTVSLLSFGKHQLGGAPAQYLSIPSHHGADVDRIALSQYVATDSPLEVHLKDGGEWTSLFGVCALTTGPSSARATVYQLNNMGDLFAQNIRRASSNDEREQAVHQDLPCGVTAQVDRDDTRDRLPLPVDSILPEYDNQSLTPFKMAPVKVLLQTYPRLPDPSNFSDSDVKIESLYSAIDSLRHVCQPSATLFRVHRYVNEELGLRISSTSLLEMLRSHPRFNVRSIHARFRQQTATVLDPSGMATQDGIHKDVDTDVRLRICHCEPRTDTEPCVSVTCVIPHTILVSKMPEIQTSVCFGMIPATEGIASDEYRAVLEQAQELYGLKE